MQESVVKLWRKRPFRRPRHIREGNIKMAVKKFDGISLTT
jgi:hypothetical protein